MATDPVVAALQAALLSGPSLELHVALGERLLFLTHHAEAVQSARAGDPADIGAL